jgi:4-amino-4-deoxy-L-arabinose transferase-like glycosyltransferase
MTWTARLDRWAGRVPWLLVLYFTAQVVIRVLVSPSLGKDEAEQVLLAQELAWGYGPQPPLYTWLVVGAFALFGDGILALALLKNLLLAAAYLLTYATAWHASRDRVVAAAAALSLLLLPQIAWESQRDLTHTVLVVFAVALFGWVLVQILERGGWWRYALLGVAFAVGVLAKFNFPIIAVAMLLAALTVTPFRARILDLRMLVAAASAALLLWRPLFWMLEHWTATMQRANKMIITRTDSLLANYVSGLWGLAEAAVQFLGLLIVVYGILLFRSPHGRTPDDAERDYARLFARSAVIALGACVAMVFAFEVTQVKDRWLTPLLYVVPLAAALWAARHLSARRMGALLGVAALCAATVIVVLPVRTVVAPAFGRTNPLNGPYRDLAAQIRAAGFERGGILAAFNLLGGNLRLQFPNAPVVTPEYPGFALPEAGPYLLVWEAGPDPRLPDKVARLFETATGRTLEPQAPRYLSAPLLHAPQERMRLGFILVPGGAGSR